MCRYAARPPIATERLTRLDDGRLLYQLRHRWRDGTTHVLFEPLELLEKIVALIPPPRFNLVRYHGILAPRARWRKDVVPAGGGVESQGHSCSETELNTATGAPTTGIVTAQSQSAPSPDETSADTHDAPPRPRNYTWAELMRRVFAVDCCPTPPSLH